MALCLQEFVVSDLQKVVSFAWNPALCTFIKRHYYWVRSPPPRRSRPRVHLHKYLVVADRTTNRMLDSLVEWNTMKHPETARIRTGHGRETIPMTEGQRHEFASSRALQRMTLKSRDFRSDWSIKVYRSTGLACADIFRAIYMFLREPLSEEEFYSIPLRTLKYSVEAFVKRCQNGEAPSRFEYREGMKRVDYLGGKTMFAGLSMEKESWVRKRPPEDCIFEILFLQPLDPSLPPETFGYSGELSSTQQELAVIPSSRNQWMAMDSAFCFPSAWYHRCPPTLFICLCRILSAVSFVIPHQCNDA